MAFTYSGNPSNSKLDWMRFTLGDTIETQVILQDEEINYILSVSNNTSQQLALAYRQCANYFAARLVKRKLGPQSEDATERQAYYAAMADKYEKNLAYAGTPPLPAYSSPKVFDKGMMTNDV